MFSNSQFNQSINNWCVENIHVEPEGFSENGQLENENKPLWGTCPTLIGTPTLPTLIMPTVGETFVNIEPTFNWSTDSLSTKFQLQIYVGFNPIIVDTVISTNTFTLEEPLDQNQYYNWRVRGINDSSSPNEQPLYSPWSNYANFYTGPIIENALFHMDNKGIIKCEGAPSGTKDYVFGIEYESVDRALLIQRRDEGADLSKVCVSNISYMSGLFRYMQFNQPIGNWDTSNVTDMSEMFYSDGIFQTPFNQPIGNWDVSNVTDMSYMFGFSAFNQPIGEWDVSNVIDMRYMFSGTPFNQPINNWNVGNVENMSYMFGWSDFNQNIGDWDVSKVYTMQSMFKVSLFNQPIGNWDVSNVTRMREMFVMSVFNQPIENWDVSNVTDMHRMFGGSINHTSHFNQPLQKWDVSNVVGMSSMFRNSDFNQQINQWCTARFDSEPDNFSTDSPLSEENKPAWGTCPIQFLPPEGIYQVDNLEVRLIPKNNVFYTVDGSLPNTGSNLYSEPVSITSTTTIKAAYIDENTNSADIYEALYTIDIPTFSLAENNITILCDDAAVGDTWEFEGTIYTKRSKEQITPANASSTCTSGIVSMDSLFSKLPDFNEDISHWDVSDVIDMSYMFDGASTFNQDISAWDVSYVTNTENMFRDAYQFNQPIGEWFLINVTTIAGMFHNATSINQPLDNWDVSNVYHAHYLFTNATSFDQSLALWNLSSLGNTNAMFDGAGLSIENYDASVAGWASHGNVSENIVLSVGGLVYCNTVGRNHLINEYGWNFIGDSRSDVCYDVEMTVSDNYPNSINITFGTLINSTNDFDVETDRLAPPAPPSDSFDARLRTNNQDYFTFYHPPTEDNNDWTLLFTPETGFAPITLSWEIEDLPANGQLLLTDMIDGSFLNVDMSEQSSVTIEQEFITQVTITHQLPVSVTETYRANWDLVGLSVELEHNDYSELFPSANPNTLYRYDGTYNEAQNLLSGRGYWLNFSEQSNLTFSGFPISELNLELRANWNLIAGLTEETIIIDENGILLPGSLYGYDGTYTEASSLTPGNGYWLAAINEGTISLIATNDNTLLSIENDGQNSEDNRNSNHSKSNRSYQLNPRLDVKMLSEAGQINFSQRGVDLPALYIDADISETYHPLQLSLPPLAPSGAVDARLDNNRWITEEKEAKIRLQQNDEPLFLTITDNTNHYEVAFLNGTNVINKIYTNDEQNILVPTTTDFVLISLYHESKDENIPLNYLLQQNYPNPFNPKTSIRYALPEASDVHLKVYNMSGQLITTLVKTSQQAGIYEVNFDASNLSSGIYFYRLVANEFSQVKRMVLMK